MESVHSHRLTYRVSLLILKLFNKTTAMSASNYSPRPLSIKAWAEEDRPREKLLLKGQRSLSDAELLAILLGSGSTHETAVDLAKRILQSLDNDLHELGKQSMAALQQFRGIGEAKAVSVIAAMELGRRRQLSPIRHRVQIRSSLDAYRVLAAQLSDLPHEEFWILCLNRANRVLQREQISTGGVASTVVDAKVVFRRALEQRASSLILIHNHPSGNLYPSQADIDLTQKLRAAGQQIDIPIMDHLIIAEGGYYSFADEGELI